MKEKIYISESEISDMIMESVQKILDEAGMGQRAQNFGGKVANGLLNFNRNAGKLYQKLNDFGNRWDAAGQSGANGEEFNDFYPTGDEEESNDSTNTNGETGADEAPVEEPSAEKTANIQKLPQNPDGTTDLSAQNGKTTNGNTVIGQNQENDKIGIVSAIRIAQSLGDYKKYMNVLNLAKNLNAYHIDDLKLIINSEKYLTKPSVFNKYKKQRVEDKL